MKELIKKRWKRLSSELSQDERYWHTTAGYIAILDETKKSLNKNLKGAVLDAGAGRLFYKKMLESKGSLYISIDAEKTHHQLGCVCDLQSIPFKDASFDTIFCAFVLEHLPEPQKSLEELSRAAKKGATIILIAPHLAYLHNEPYDYFRYTRHGLKILLEAAGFEIRVTRELGGLFSFIGYIAATVILSLTYGIPVVWQVAFHGNKILQKMLMCLDNLTKLYEITPLNYIVIARKKKSTS